MSYRPTRLVVALTLALAFAAPEVAKADDGPNGPHSVPVDSVQTGRCWRDRQTIVTDYLASHGVQAMPLYTGVKAGSFSAVGAADVTFVSCGQTDFGTLSTSIQSQLNGGGYDVRLIAASHNSPDTWYVNPFTTFDKKRKLDYDGYPPYPGDPVTSHVEYRVGKKWKPLWGCNAWFTLYDRTLGDVDWIAMNQAEFDIPEADVMDDIAYDNANANTLWDGLCGAVPGKPGHYSYKLRMRTPRYDYVACTVTYSSIYCTRHRNTRKSYPLKGHIKIHKSATGQVTVRYVR